MGGCEDCGEYTKPNQDGKVCAADKCEGTDMVLKNGSCGPCGEGETTSMDRKSCIKNPCGDNQRLLNDDVNCIRCDSY